MGLRPPRHDGRKASPGYRAAGPHVRPGDADTPMRPPRRRTHGLLRNIGAKAAAIAAQPSPAPGPCRSQPAGQRPRNGWGKVPGSAHAPPPRAAADQAGLPSHLLETGGAVYLGAGAQDRTYQPSPPVYECRPRVRWPHRTERGLYRDAGRRRAPRLRPLVPPPGPTTCGRARAGLASSGPPREA